MGIANVLQLAKGGINKCFVGKEPWQIVTITTSTVLIFIWCYDTVFVQNESKITENYLLHQ